MVIKSNQTINSYHYLIINMESEPVYSLEQRLVDSYVSRINESKRKVAARLRERCLKPEDLLPTADFLAAEVDSHICIKSLLLKEKEKKMLKDAAFEGYKAIRDKVQIFFEDKAKLFPMPGPVFAYYVPERDEFVVSVAAFCKRATGSAVHITMHEQEHRRQRMRHGIGMGGPEPLVEGLAEARTLIALSSVDGTDRELMERYIGLSEHEEHAKAMRREGSVKHACLLNIKLYINNIVAPSIAMEMIGKGKTEDDIREYFGKVCEKTPYLPIMPSLLRYALISGLLEADGG